MLGLGCGTGSPADGGGTTSSGTIAEGTTSASTSVAGGTTDLVPDLPSVDPPEFDEHVVDLECGVLEIADHDGDGNPELLALPPTDVVFGAFELFMLAGQARPMAVVGTTELESTWRVASADMDVDGRDDIVLSGNRIVGMSEEEFTDGLRASGAASWDPLLDAPWVPPADFPDRAVPLPGGARVLRSSGDIVELLQWNQAASALEVIEGSRLVLPVRVADVAVVELGPTDATRVILPSLDDVRVLVEDAMGAFTLESVDLQFPELARLRTIDVDGDGRRDVLGRARRGPQTRRDLGRPR
jgi:hypothetical protein